MSWSLTTVLSLLEIIGINIVLSGDNAVVVAMAINRLEPRHRRPALVFGLGGAMLLQILATLIISRLFRIPLLSCVGGMCLSWIALRLLWDEARDKHGSPSPESLGRAIWTIIFANCVMSLDNVVAVASIGSGRPVLIAIGLGLSILFTLASSVLIAEWMSRYPLLVTLGASILAWTGGRMIAADSVVSQAVAVQFGIDLKDGPLWFALSLAMTAFVLLVSRHMKPKTPISAEVGANKSYLS